MSGQWQSVDQKTIKELSSTGSHQECLQACHQLLQSEPENPLPWKYAGKSLLALGQFEKAQQCLIKAHQLDTKDPETTENIGNIYLNLGHTEEATQWYKRSLQINNNYAPAICNIANIKRQSGNNQEAVNLFEQAIQADPQLVQAYAGAATSSLALGDLDQARSFAIRAIEINAHAPGINEIMGITFQSKRNYQQAVESYQRELAINPKSNTSLLNLGLLLLQQGKAAAAIEPLTRAAAINTSEQCSLLLAQAYQNVGKLKEAIIEYKKIDIIQSQNKMIPFNLGLCLLNTGSNIDAIEAFKIAIKLDESFLPAWGNIGTALMNEGCHHEALLATQKVLELDPENPTAFTNLGGIYRDLGNLDQALASTLKSLELKPDNPDAHENLGVLYKDLGNLDQALASTLKSLELKPDNPDTHMNLGCIYKDLGNLDQALAFLTKAMKSEKTKEKAAVKLAETYYYLGNYHEGVKAISNISNKKSVNLLLSLYLCLNKKPEFNRCAEDLIHKGWLNPQGIAAIDHANVLYGQMLDNGLDGSSLDSVFVQPINKQEFSDELLQELLIRLTTGSLQSRAQGHLVNGLQTSGNILDFPEKPFQVLKELLVQKIDIYNQTCDINTDKNFRVNWEKNLYRLIGWAIVMNKGGNLKTHNHEKGWLSGTFYLQMPEKGANQEEGAIEFSHQGPRYPSGNAVFEKRLIQPSARDLNIFSSALFHRTHPFQSEKQRICIAFDVSERIDL